MKTFSTFLIEARKNPDQNPKVSLYDVAEKYENDSSIFMSYVSDVNLVRASRKVKDVNSDKLNNLDPLKSTWKDEEAVHIEWEKQSEKLKKHSSAFEHARESPSVESQQIDPNHHSSQPWKSVVLAFVILYGIQSR